MPDNEFKGIGVIALDVRGRAYLRFLEPNTRYAVERSDEGLFRLTPLLDMTREEFNLAVEKRVAEERAK